MRISCKKCETTLSKDVAPITSYDVLSEEDGSDYVPEGFAFQEDGGYWTGHKDCWCINKRDAINLTKTTDLHRLNGCCDLDGCDGPNMVCANCQSEVATAKLDCWMPHAVMFETSSVHIAT
jgi:hypothetical protein